MVLTSLRGRIIRVEQTDNKTLLRKMRLVLIVFSLFVCTITALPVTNDQDDNSPHFLNKFLIKVDKRSTAQEIAEQYGFTIKDELSEIGYLLLEHSAVSRRSKRTADHHVRMLKEDPRVTFAEQQKILKREKRVIMHDKQLELPLRNYAPEEYYRAPEHRSNINQGLGVAYMSFNDPYYQDEWYCNNYGQTGGTNHVDLNIMPAWLQGFTGKGISVQVLDDGIDYTHPDIKDNFDAYASADFNDENKDDPTPDKTDQSNSHGTRCAGEIAAVANNSHCAVGVAYECKISGIRLLDGEVTDHLEAKAMIFRHKYVDVKTASWGPRDNGATLEGPGQATLDALHKGVTEGRGGKGIVYVWATGNGGVVDDDCDCDGYVSAVETLSIGSINDRGEAPYFMEKCASTMAVVPSGGEIYAGEYNGKPKIKVVTTDLNGGCTLGFEGTSAAAPLAAGCIALTLQANPDLSWRDVQHIVAKTAKIPHADKTWVINGAGNHVSHTFGFGVLDCGHMVSAAQNWINVDEQKRCESELINVNEEITSRGCVIRKILFPKSCTMGQASRVDILEHVQVYTEVEHSRRGDVQIYVESPRKTESTILSTRKNDRSNLGIKFKFMTVHTWGEEPFGEWQVKVCDNRKTKYNNTGSFKKFQFFWYGTSTQKKKRDSNIDAEKPTLETIQEKMKKELKESLSLNIKRLQPENVQKSLKESRNNKENEKVNSPPEKKDDTDKIIDDLAKILKDRGFDAKEVESMLNRISGSDSEKSENSKRFEDRSIDTKKKKFGNDIESINYGKREESIDELLDRFISGRVQSLGNRRELEEGSESQSRFKNKKRNHGYN